MLRRALLVLVSLGAACASQSAATRAEAPAGATSPPAEAAPAEAAPAPAPLDVKALFAREVEPLAPQAFSSPEAGFSGQVEASAPVTVVRGEGYTQLTIPVGTAMPLECFVYDERRDAAGTLQGVVQSVGEELTLRMVRPAGVSVLKEAPALFLELVYSSERDGQPSAGHVKLMVHADNSLPVLCTHDEPGYTESFRRIASGLAGGLQPSQPRYPTPRYSEVQVMKVQGLPVGFEWKAIYDAETKGHAISETMSAMLLPRSATELVSNDSTTSAITDAKGQLLEMEYAKVENGELQVRASAKKEKGSTWRYEGTHSGKKLQGTFQAPKGGLTTELAMTGAVKKLMAASSPKPLAFALYVPGLDPTAPVTMEYVREAGTPNGLTVKLGSVQLAAQVDGAGLLERYEMAVGSATMVQERAFVRGTP